MPRNVVNEMPTGITTCMSEAEPPSPNQGEQFGQVEGDEAVVLEERERDEVENDREREQPTALARSRSSAQPSS